MGRLLTILAAILLGPAPTGIAATRDDPTRPTSMIVQFPADGLPTRWRAFWRSRCDRFSVSR